MKLNIDRELEEYQKFAFNKNMIEVSVGLILATAFHNTTKSICDNVLMPLINFALTEANGDWRKWNISPAKGLNFEIGNLIGSLIDFVIISFVLFVFYKKFYKSLEQKAIDKKVDIEYHI